MDHLIPNTCKVLHCVKISLLQSDAKFLREWLESPGDRPIVVTEASLQHTLKLSCASCVSTIVVDLVNCLQNSLLDVLVFSSE